MIKTKIGIVGYGNLGRGVEKGIKLCADMELVGIFTRRDPKNIDSDSPVYNINEILEFKDKIDVLILCGGSANDIPEQAPILAKDFNTVDSFDNHKFIPQYYKKMDEIAKNNENVSVISSGWDPGLFSINRILSEAILPDGENYTFWGKGVSQGHSDAIRRIEGVKSAIQYTIPNQDMIDDIGSGKDVEYESHNAHKRDCYVVLEEGYDEDQIRESIVNMPEYFAGYETTVNFINQDEFDKNHRGMPHGGQVIRRGYTSDENLALYKFSLELGSNPEFTASVNIAYARACHRLALEKKYGAYTVIDIAPIYLSPKSDEEIRKMI
ncbi:MAG: diaminopimelate dehydrogenase [Tissierellia bacterium]|nr:diaminopimelate dehydrogenase [Tissierellia bacterium]